MALTQDSRFVIRKPCGGAHNPTKVILLQRFQTGWKNHFLNATKEVNNALGKRKVSDKTRSYENPKKLVPMYRNYANLKVAAGISHLSQRLKQLNSQRSFTDVTLSKQLFLVSLVALGQHSGKYITM
ncbi:hypothetical protein SAMN05444008_12640 [Cnuella takakiae]|uniref:Uncharacterized protein n=1 Tax=Cnuella takakiae TaxID=1302690 RepID=A0A1M5IYK9_9BACT|nr:hypothetical protein SAMN05444008_12640 [Cnuella takakiae]